MRAHRTRGAPAKPRERLPEALIRGMGHLMLLSGVGTALGLALILFFVFSGALAYGAIGGTYLETQARNLGLAQTVFLWCLSIVVITALIRHYRSDSVGLLVLLGGIACWGVLPLAIRAHVSEYNTSLIALAESLIASVKTAGGVLMVVGLLRLVVGRVALLSTPTPGAARVAGLGAAAAEIAVQRAAQRPSLMRRCWELQFCRGNLKVNCPRFLEGASCWKKGGGCYCDQGLATRLLSGVGVQARVQVAEELEAAQRQAQKVSAGRRYASKKQKRPRRSCRECPIYLDHQVYKYRALSWLCYPLAAALTGIFFARIQYGYEWVEAELGTLLSHAQVLPHYLASRPLAEGPWLTAENAMVALVGVFIVGVILRLTELFVFQLKW
jgi:hypothetical protein